MQKTQHSGTHVLASGERGLGWEPVHAPNPMLGTLLLLGSVLMCLAYITWETRAPHVESPEVVSVTVGLDGSVNVKRTVAP